LVQDDAEAVAIRQKRHRIIDDVGLCPPAIEPAHGPRGPQPLVVDLRARTLWKQRQFSRGRPGG